MTCPCLSNDKKLYISLQTALLAFLFFNPMLFKAVASVLGRWVAGADGAPTMLGLALHAVLFGLVLYLLMRPTTPKKAAEEAKSQRQNVPGLPLL
jgi:hypothetical protein